MILAKDIYFIIFAVGALAVGSAIYGYDTYYTQSHEIIDTARKVFAKIDHRGMKEFTEGRPQDDKYYFGYMFIIDSKRYRGSGSFHLIPSEREWVQYLPSNPNINDPYLINRAWDNLKIFWFVSFIAVVCIIVLFIHHCRCILIKRSEES